MTDILERTMRRSVFYKENAAHRFVRIPCLANFECGKMATPSFTQRTAEKSSVGDEKIKLSGSQRFWQRMKIIVRHLDRTLERLSEPIERGRKNAHAFRLSNRVKNAYAHGRLGHGKGTQRQDQTEDRD